MSITPDELAQCEERLQAEIVERECLLAAIRVLRGHASKGQSLATVDLGVLGSVLRPSLAKTLTLESAAEEAPKPLLAPTPPKPYVHPELQAIIDYLRTDVRVVWWAIRRMTDDFTVRDIGALLKREGYGLRTAAISVVLTRLKRRGELEEIRRSYGPKPALFRNPNLASPVDAQSENPAVTATSTPEAAAA